MKKKIAFIFIRCCFGGELVRLCGKCRNRKWGNHENQRFRRKK